MRNRLIILAGVTALSVAGAAAPAYAWHHHRAHSASHQSTPAERAQTADLNRQQLAQAGNTSATMPNENMGVSTPAQQNSLTTEPTSYQRPGSSGGMNGNMQSGTTGSTTATGTGAGMGEDQNVGTPKGNAPTNLQGNPSGSVAPPPTTTPSTPQ